MVLASSSVRASSKSTARVLGSVVTVSPLPCIRMRHVEPLELLVPQPNDSGNVDRCGTGVASERKALIQPHNGRTWRPHNKRCLDSPDHTWDKETQEYMWVGSRFPPCCFPLSGHGFMSSAWAAASRARRTASSAVPASPQIALAGHWNTQISPPSEE